MENLSSRISKSLALADAAVSGFPRKLQLIATGAPMTCVLEDLDSLDGALCAVHDEQSRGLSRECFTLVAREFTPGF